MFFSIVMLGFIYVAIVFMPGTSPVFCDRTHNIVTSSFFFSVLGMSASDLLLCRDVLPDPRVLLQPLSRFMAKPQMPLVAT
jgi:hypothetical protein